MPLFRSKAKEAKEVKTPPAKPSLEEELRSIYSRRSGLSLLSFVLLIYCSPLYSTNLSSFMCALGCVCVWIGRKVCGSIWVCMDGGVCMLVCVCRCVYVGVCLLLKYCLFRTSSPALVVRYFLSCSVVLNTL